MVIMMMKETTTIKIMTRGRRGAVKRFQDDSELENVKYKRRLTLLKPASNFSSFSADTCQRIFPVTDTRWNFELQLSPQLQADRVESATPRWRSCRPEQRRASLNSVNIRATATRHGVVSRPWRQPATHHRAGTRPALYDDHGKKQAGGRVYVRQSKSGARRWVAMRELWRARSQNSTCI